MHIYVGSNDVHRKETAPRGWIFLEDVTEISVKPVRRDVFHIKKNKCWPNEGSDDKGLIER